MDRFRFVIRRPLLLVMLALPALAQPLSETIEVRVANVDVVVTDRAGKPIHGLTKDDFELFENGKAQPITNFYEVASEIDGQPAAPQPARQRSIVVFIDNTSLDPLRRNQVIDAVVRALDRLLRPGDDAMIIGWNRGTQVLQPFTTDRDALKRVLEDSRKSVGTSATVSFQKEEALSYARAAVGDVLARRRSASDAYNDSISKARSYAEWMNGTERILFASLQQACSLLSGTDGKKVLLFVGGEMQRNPGMDLFQQVDALFIPLIRGHVTPAVLQNDLNLSFDLDKVAHNANANGVTMYMIDALDRTHGASESESTEPEVDFINQSNSMLSMAALASSTGGSILSGSSNFAGALDNISRDLGSYYSLGYKPGPGATDRRIAVKVRRPGAVARTRSGYALKTAEQQNEDRVVANAFHPTLTGDFPVTITADPPEPYEKGLVKVKVTLTFPATLTYLPDGDNLAGEYAVMFVTADDDGSFSQVSRQARTVKFPAAVEAQMKQTSLTHTAGLIVRPVTRTISVAVVDRLGARTGFAKTTIASLPKPAR